MSSDEEVEDNNPGLGDSSSVGLHSGSDKSSKPEGILPYPYSLLLDSAVQLPSLKKKCVIKIQ